MPEERHSLPKPPTKYAEHAGDDALTPQRSMCSITEETVKSRVKSILSKLGANDPTHAAMIGLKRGIIEL